MRLQPIIVPGWNNSGPDHWQTQWERTLPRAVRIAPRDWAAPCLADWVSCLVAEIETAARPPLLIAHSLGCIAVGYLPQPIRDKVAGALLVAPADVERSGAPASLKSFSPVPLHSLPFQSVVVASSNDPFCSIERARQFAHAWGSRFEQIEGAGHINAESGYGPWPEGLRLLFSLRRRAHWRVPVPSCRTPPLPTGHPTGSPH